MTGAILVARAAHATRATLGNEVGLGYNTQPSASPRITSGVAPVVLPLHPRTARRIDEFGLAHRLAPLQITEPLDYPDFLALAHSAALLISDSGGVQEEASVVKTPIIIVRRSTERPEIEATFGLRVTPSRDLGGLARQWLYHSDRHHHDLADLPSPFGDGTAAHRIADALNQLTQPALIAQARRQVTLQEIFDEVEHDTAPSSAPLEATTALVREVRKRSGRW